MKTTLKKVETKTRVSQAGRQVTVAPGIQLIPSRKGKYRARKMIAGERFEFQTNNLAEAKKWLRKMNKNS